MGAPRPAGPQPRDGLQRALPLDPHGPIGRGPPLREPRVDTADDVHVRARQAGRDRADLAVAEWEPVDRQDRRDLVAAAAEERPVGGVALRPGPGTYAHMCMCTSSRISFPESTWRTAS